MITTTRGAVRAPARPRPAAVVQVVRAALLAATAVAFAAGAHVLAGGLLPEARGTVAVVVLTFALTSAVARTRLRLRTLLPTLVLLQLALHHAFAALAGHAPGTELSSGGAHAHHAAPDAAPDLVAGLATAAHQSTGMHPGMLAAHVGAAALTGVVVVAADRAAEAAVDWFTAVVPRLLGFVPLAIPVPGARRRAPRRVVRPAQVFLTARPLRGPPAASAATA
ncbi:hypothetical protein CLV28_1091 [Sediminihabitans luteus]|uniref:Uncharacterized protein n=1 Tax=Sediminihabitans luteus TaxID=1138585 RepID=A0A2M9D1A2_9CELL|nr:hypothetical protein [Sediminihabitans luteus]PJJ77865.1 hypothetical protein CLV28_1091 [Sediminihabitans luteus]GII99777.1 hypothetical protein Slu03_21550 [Sediminihabitans luteus]